MAFVKDTQSWVRRYGAPVTLALIVSQIVIGLLTFVTLAKGITPFVLSNNLPSQPWSLITYPFVSIIGGGFGVIGFVFGILWMHWVGGSTERDLGSVKYAAFLLTATILFGLLLFVGASVLRAPLVMLGPWLPISALTVVWGSRNPSSQIRMYGVLPITGMQLCYLDAAAVLFGIGWATQQPILGVVACLPLYLAYLFASNKLGPITYSRPIYQPKQSKAAKEREESYFDEVRRREKEREERERLRKLFEVHDNDQTGS